MRTTDRITNFEKRHGVPKTTRRRVTTVSDLLVRDDVTGILADLNRDKADIKDLIVIAVNRKTGGYSWQITEDTMESTIIWLIECLKRDVMAGEGFDD